MSNHRGEVRAVAYMPQGSELTGDVAVGASQFVVDNPVDFDEDGGTVSINGVTYAYSSCDMDTGTVVLAGTTSAAATDGDRVFIVSGGQIATDYIAFVSLGDGDEVEVRIPFAEIDLWPEGDYADPVIVDLSDDLERIIDVPGRTPLRSGSFLDPSTLPAPPVTDGSAPASSPTPTVTGGVGALFVRWVPPGNHDPLTFDLHVSPTQGFTPDATTLAAANTGATSATIRKLPTPVGTPANDALLYGVPYYFRVQAKDADGAAAMGAESAAAYMVQVTGPDVAAQSVTAEHIVAGSITGELLAGEVVLGSTISTGALNEAGEIVGARVELGPDGLTNYAADGHAVVRFPTDPAEEAYVEANLHVLSADIDDNLTLYGNNNQLAANASMFLGAGVTAPSSPPTLSQSYDYVQLDRSVYDNPSTDPTYDLGAFALDPAQVTSICWDPGTTSWQVAQQRSNGFRYWRFNPDGSWKRTPLNDRYWHDDYRDHMEVTVSRRGWLMFFQGTTWWVWDSPNNRWGTLPASWLLGADSRPYLTTDDAAGLFMLCQNVTGGVPKGQQVRRFHTVAYVGGNVQPCVSDSVTTLPSGMGHYQLINGAYYGSADFGGARYALTQPATNLVKVSTATTRQDQTGSYQEWRCNGNPLGFDWDGTNFWSLDTTGKLWKYTGWTWTTEPMTTWVGMSAYDSDATGGTHETPVGALATLNAARRAKLVITVPKTLDTGASDDPDQWRVYQGRLAGTTVPTATQIKLVTALGSPSVSTSTTITTDATGITPPGGIYGQAGAVNTFPGGNPAKLLDGSGQTMVDAQGHGSVGMVGEVRMFAGLTIPTGWLKCDGTAISRTQYAALYAVVGNIFGAGNGTSTFNLPDLRGRFPLGAGGTGKPSIGDFETGITGNAPGQGLGSSLTHLHSHVISGEASDPTPQTPGTAGGAVVRNTQYGGHSHGGATGTKGLNNSTTTDLHPLLTLNFIIRY